MRMIALGIALSAAFATLASANTLTWTDQAMRLVFTAPQDWRIDQRVGLGEHDLQTFVVAGEGELQCQFNSDANWDTASETPGGMLRHMRDAFTPETWAAALNKFPEIFPNNSARIASTSLDTSDFWPVQRAEAESEHGTVLAAFEQRPGVDIVTVCVISGGEAQRAIYEDIIRSVGHPSDSILQTAAEMEIQYQANAE